jgi:acyl carrier protein
MHDRLRRVFAETFEVDPAAIPEDASIETLDGWDSLRQLELMLALELEFGVHLPSEAMLELTSAQAIEDFLAEHGAA